MCVGCQSKNKKAVYENKNIENCRHRITELTDLDFKLRDLYYIGKERSIFEASELISSWIVDIESKCPNEDLLTEIKKLIKDEYAKYKKAVSK